MYKSDADKAYKHKVFLSQQVYMQSEKSAVVKLVKNANKATTYSNKSCVYSVSNISPLIC